MIHLRTRLQQVNVVLILVLLMTIGSYLFQYYTFSTVGLVGCLLLCVYWYRYLGEELIITFLKSHDGYGEYTDLSAHYSKHALSRLHKRGIISIEGERVILVMRDYVCAFDRESPRQERQEDVSMQRRWRDAFFFIRYLKRIRITTRVEKISYIGFFLLIITLISFLVRYFLISVIGGIGFLVSMFLVHRAFQENLIIGFLKYHQGCGDYNTLKTAYSTDALSRLETQSIIRIEGDVVTLLDDLYPCAFEEELQHWYSHKE